MTSRRNIEKLITKIRSTLKKFTLSPKWADNSVFNEIIKDENYYWDITEQEEQKILRQV